MKKTTQSQDIKVISEESQEEEIKPVKFPVGFKYVFGNNIFTVKEIVDKDPTCDMRRIIDSTGTVEIIPVTSIEKDLKQEGIFVLETGENTEEEKKNE